MCKAVSMTMDNKSNIYYFDLKIRKELCKSNPKDYEPDSHASIADLFKLNEDKCDKFEIDFKNMTVVVDQSLTEITDKNKNKLQEFVNKKDKSFWRELVLNSHVLWIENNIAEWMFTDGTFSAPVATKLDCRNNQLTKLSAPVATTLFCNNNQITKLSAPVATTFDCRNNQLTKLRAPVATWVDCSNNQLTKLNAPVATMLICSNNQLTKLSASVATTLDCSNNKLTDLSAPIATYLYCNNNPNFNF